MYLEAVTRGVMATGGTELTDENIPFKIVHISG